MEQNYKLSERESHTTHISNSKERSIEILLSKTEEEEEETKKIEEKKKTKKIVGQTNVEHHLVHQHINNGITRGEVTEKRIDKIFKDILAENNLNLVKNFYIHIQEA